MPSTSKRQQHAMCMAYAARKGELKVKDLKGAALEIYKSDMTDKQIKDFTVLKEMVSLRDYLGESAGSLYENLLGNTRGDFQAEIEEWCEINLYPGYVIKGNKIGAKVSFRISATSLELPDGFEWGNVDSFDCNSCNKLVSLKGCPRQVDNFDCSDCVSIKSLKGAPEKVNGDFTCTGCNSLTNLEGAPKEIGGSFECANCKNLESLKGAPEKVNGDFVTNNCHKLESADYAPAHIGGYFKCKGCNRLLLNRESI